jgi:[acyl-carrier-protein] S-malonyltransferase
MAAILALPEDVAERICSEITSETGEVVVPANYNCPGQLVISGTNKGIDIACERMKAAGAKRALKLPVGGAFHSPLMEPAKIELEAAIMASNFHKPSCPVYQNVVAKAVIDPDEIRQNLVDQLTGPVLWSQSIEAMIADGATTFTEVGPGKVLQGLIGKINKEIPVESIN